MPGAARPTRVKTLAQDSTTEWDGAGFEPPIFPSLENQRYIRRYSRSLLCTLHSPNDNQVRLQQNPFTLSWGISGY